MVECKRTEPFTLGTYAWRGSICTLCRRVIRALWLHWAGAKAAAAAAAVRGSSLLPEGAWSEWGFCTPSRAPLSDRPSSNWCLVHSMFSENDFKKFVLRYLLWKKSKYPFLTWDQMPPRNIFSWVNFEPLHSRESSWKLRTELLVESAVVMCFLSWTACTMSFKLKWQVNRKTFLTFELLCP